MISSIVQFSHIIDIIFNFSSSSQYSIIIFKKLINSEPILSLSSKIEIIYFNIELSFFICSKKKFLFFSPPTTNKNFSIILFEKPIFHLSISSKIKSSNFSENHIISHNK